MTKALILEKVERANKLKWLKILKNENTDESKECPLILLQPFRRLAYTTFYIKKETIFGAFRKNLVLPINFIVLTEFLKIIIKADLVTVICLPIYTIKQSDHRIKQVKTYLRLLRKAVIEIRLNSIGKD